MEDVPAAARDEFRADLVLVHQTCRSAVGSQRARSQDNTWEIWCGFCEELQVDPLLEGVQDPIQFLEVFAQRYRDGRLAKRGNPVYARSVEDAIRAIGQTMASMGAKDQRLEAPRRQHYRLAQLFRGWKRVDPSTKRVKPAPLTLVHDVHKHSHDPASRAVADMCYVGFFFLCRPGEHTASGTTDSLCDPFRLRDIELHLGNQVLRATNAPLASVIAAGSTTLEYSDQKNGTQSEGVTHGLSSDPVACPVKTIIRRVLHLRHNNAPPDTPLHTYYKDGIPAHTRATDLTIALRASATRLFSTLGINPADISARSLRSGGATALLCAGVDSDITKLIGRWRSDEMLKYLHVRAVSLMRDYASKMFHQGNFTFAPGQDLPNEAPVPAPVPL